MIIDNREIFKNINIEDPRKMIKNTLLDKYGIEDCSIGQLLLGDFLWVIKILSIYLN